jgi:hypothetical protein
MNHSQLKLTIMKKLLLTLIVTTAIALGSFAQTTTAPTTTSHGGFSIGVDAGLPTGDISVGYSGAIGGSIKYDAPTSPITCFTISAGYEALLVKSAFKDLGVEASDNFVPLKAGLKVYVSPNFFLEAQAGVAIYTGAGGTTFFAYSPGIGYSFDGGFELGARYEAWSKDGTIGQAAVRLAFRFK